LKVNDDDAVLTLGLR